MPNFPLAGPVLREDLPLYPPLIQLLRVTAATVAGPAGVAQTVGSSVPGPTLYVSFTQQLRTDALLPRDREPCLADDVNGKGLTPGYYLGRLAGSHTSLPVYEVGSSSSGGGSDAITNKLEVVKCLESGGTPDVNGYYSGRLQNYGANGKLLDTGIMVYFYDANGLFRLLYNNNYLCRATDGTYSGRTVYVVEDANFIAANESYSQIVYGIEYFQLIPDRCWSITELAARIANIRRLFDVYDSAIRNTGDVDRITFHKVTPDTDTDFDVTEDTVGRVRVKANGYTGAFYVLTNCVAGVLKKKLLTFVRGLLKTVGAEIDL